MAIIPKPKKPLESLTSLEREKEKKRLQAQTEELVSEMGQESDRKAVRTVQMYGKELEEQERIVKELDTEKLKKLSRNKIYYQRYLIHVLKRFIKDEDLPKKYRFHIESNDQGIALGIVGTNFIKAFKATGIPFYDLHACKLTATQVGNTVARLEGNFRSSESGILLVDKEEFDKFVKKPKWNQ